MGSSNFAKSLKPASVKAETKSFTTSESPLSMNDRRLRTLPERLGEAFILSISDWGKYAELDRKEANFNGSSLEISIFLHVLICSLIGDVTERWSSG